MSIWTRLRVAISAGRRAYEAAASGAYSTNRHRFATESPDGAVSGGQGETLKQWGRHLDENHDLTVGVLDELVAKVIGRGIGIDPAVRLRSGELDEATNDQLRDLLEVWTMAPETRGDLEFDEMQRLICRAWLRDGECFIRDIIGPSSGFLFGRGDLPYRVELLEAEMLPWDYSKTSPAIVMGVEQDAWHRAVAFWFFKEH